jgi:glycosyltransferase involved in cell wall biosynthesis
VTGLLPIRLPDEIPAPRLRDAMGIPPSATVFVSTFEPASDPQRKNPIAVVDAFRRGVGQDADAYLVMRVNNADVDGVEHPFVQTLRRQIDGHPCIRVSTEALSYPEIIGLYAECDVFVSLHRAEGLGLAMAEAMLLGKPVIATAWSGNLTFMDRLSACLVGYRLMPVREASTYEPDELEDTTVWADADVDEAATWMQRLSRDATLRDRIGRAARERMREYGHDASDGKVLLELKALWEQHNAFPRVAHDVHDTQDELRRLRSSRLAQYQEVERELRWIKSRMTYRVATGLKRALKRNVFARLIGGVRH